MPDTTKRGPGRPKRVARKRLVNLDAVETALLDQYATDLGAPIGRVVGAALRTMDIRRARAVLERLERNRHGGT